MSQPGIAMSVPVRPPASARVALGSVAIQAVGASATLLAGACVAKVFGVEAQGEFALLKGWADALATAGMLGLPQALLHASYQSPGSVWALQGFAARVVALGAGLALVLALASHFSPWPWMCWPLLAAPAFVAHGLMRALQLRQRGPLAYAALTVAPACALLVAVLVMSALHTPHWGLALCVSAFFSAAWAWAMRLREAPPGCAQTPPPRGLWQTNTHAFAQNMSAAAQPALMLSLLPALGATPRAVGELAMSMLFLQVMAAGANFAAPAAYDRVARGQRLWPAGKGASLAGLAVLATLVALWLTPWCLNLLLPAQEWASPALTSSTRWAVLAGVLTFTARLVGTVLQAHGRFAALSVQAGLRLGLSLGLTWVLARMSVPLPVAGALAWAITEALITAHGVACLRGPVTSATR